MSGRDHATSFEKRSAGSIGARTRRPLLRFPWSRGDNHVKAIVAAYHNMGCMGLEAMCRADYEIVGVFTHVDDPTENIWFDSVAEWAAARDIAVFSPQNINHPLWVETIAGLQPDVLFTFYYRHLIGDPILEIPPRGGFNLHGSLLPKYRGRAPVNWVLVNGERETGVTLHHMTARPDAGDIVAQIPVTISAQETAHSLNRKLVATAARLLDETLPMISAGHAPRVPQNHDRASCYGRRRPEDGEIDWHQSAESIRNLIRATTQPYPGAYTWCVRRKLIVWDAKIIQFTADSGRAGEIISSSPLTVVTGHGALELRYVQLDGDIYRGGADLATEQPSGSRFDAGKTSQRRCGAGAQNSSVDPWG